MTQDANFQLGDLDAHHYKSHSEVQYKLAQTPLQHYPFIGNEWILDIGCGDGKITAQIAERVPQGQVIGVDKSQAMISLAQGSFSKSHYPNLSFQQQDACSLKLKGAFDLVTSFSCLHWIKNQRLALENICKYLKPQAKAILVTFPRCATFWDPIEAVAAKQKWKPFFEEDPKPYHFLNEDQYKSLLGMVGLKIIHIETTSHVTQFLGKKGFEDYVRGWLPFLLYLPKHLHAEFLDEIGTESLKFAPVAADGFVYHPYDKILIYAQSRDK